MPPLHSRATRQLVKERNKIDGPRSLHRGIHYQENEAHASSYMQNAKKKRADHRDLLVHHQRINEDLQDIYTRTAALHSDNMTMVERIEENWKKFERIGGKRPTNVRTRGQDAVLCANQTAVPYAERLAQVSQQKEELRERGAWERLTHGEAVDYSEGSALHAAKDKRVQMFQRRQLRRAHLLRRVGDPTPLKQSGTYDMNSGTLQVFNKTIRNVQREVAHDARIAEVRQRRKNSRSQWDVNESGNVNRPDQEVLRYSRDWELGPRRKGRGGGGGGGRGGRKRERDEL
ncbi:conserved hypothetical protein [Leishmania mexicana MHOM/GT/2001/U1103]|uniref:Uncharacterized protein n=1 Tax=Leishmania mexicana (strain MHOM/GT/2001/U1103) TaxID=929439 RepID=E9AMW6_LEIMU|nr:conserved hypothetical protein [Leishmania mexicana MHOM/GT/2001/U1103]CBZ24271.1 conserved hypothetical protein [Leishmania mexicana MHOM/GT/2001/U1103]